MYTNAQYLKDNTTNENNCIKVDINGITCFVPIDIKNGDYNEIMRQVKSGELIIADTV